MDSLVIAVSLFSFGTVVIKIRFIKSTQPAIFLLYHMSHTSIIFDPEPSARCSARFFGFLFQIHVCPFYPVQL